MPAVTSLDNFWKYVEKIPFHACWEWIGHKDKNGYGRLTYAKKDLRAHRFSYEIHNIESIPKGMSVLHSCDNPSCVNPDHLSIGTNYENTQDCIAKGRSYGTRLKQRTHCKFGHEYTQENTYMVLGTKRRCRICSAVTAKNFRSRREANHGE